MLSSGVNRSDSVRDKSNSFEDRPFLGIMYVIWSSYLSCTDVSSLEPAQDPESMAFRLGMIVTVPVPGPGWCAFEVILV